MYLNWYETVVHRFNNQDIQTLHNREVGKELEKISDSNIKGIKHKQICVFIQ